MAKTIKEQTTTDGKATITVPWGDYPQVGHEQHRVELRLSDRYLREKWHQLRRSVRATGQTLHNGDYVNSNGDLLRWLLEQLPT